MNAVARDVRRARSRARRERQSLGDALYVIYVCALASLFPLSALFTGAPPGPGPGRAAAAAAVPLLLVAVGVGVLVGRSAAAVRGGPVVLPPEDARLLLTWPVPRRDLVLPALLAALCRAAAGGLAATLVLLYVQVRALGAPARAVGLDDLLLPLLLALVGTLAAWLVQAHPAVASAARLAGAAGAVALLVALCWAGRQLADAGPREALLRLARLGPVPADLPFGGVVRGAAPPAGLLVALLLLVLLVPLALLSLRAATRVTPEQLLSRSRRADVTRTALRLGFTSSVYLTRTEPVRRSRRRRRAVPGRTPSRALVAKAVLQEQGAPLVPRLLAVAAVVGASLAAAERVTTGQALAATMAAAVAVAGALTVVATRFADPVRLDVDRAPLAAAIPLRHSVLARADVGVSAAVALVGSLLGLATVGLLGVVPADRLSALVVPAAALAVLLAAAGALGALSDDPSPLLPPAVAVGYRTSGFVAVGVACVGAALALRLPGPPGSPPSPDRLPTATLLLVVVTAVAAGLAVSRASAALTHGR